MIAGPTSGSLANSSCSMTPITFIISSTAQPRMRRKKRAGRPTVSRCTSASPSTPAQIQIGGFADHHKIGLDLAPSLYAGPRFQHFFQRACADNDPPGNCGSIHRRRGIDHGGQRAFMSALPARRSRHQECGAANGACVQARLAQSVPCRYARQRAAFCPAGADAANHAAIFVHPNLVETQHLHLGLHPLRRRLLFGRSGLLALDKAWVNSMRFSISMFLSAVLFHHLDVAQATSALYYPPEPRLGRRCGIAD